ncbi:MFS transporter [Aminobacter sp. HY435]|uniref:MFS transporter n=1 Tax=Aminobacter sp. HY435 TaxID=2970917 RepID=UPI0022B961B6|nr:MFS transporter [Aminobacter sp. HY435]
MDDDHKYEQGSALEPFKHSTFRSVWFASLASNFGGLIQAVGAAWLMTSIATSSDMVALVQASISLPIMLFSLVSGALADSYDRRRVMLTAQCFMLAVSALLTLVAYLGLITPWLLLTFTFLIGCGTALNNPSWQASVGDMVPRPVMPAAVALNSMGFNMTRSVGPAIGGIIVAAAGAAAAFAVNTLSYFALIIVLFRWRPQIPKNALPRETLGQAVGAGLRYVAMSPNIAKVLLRSFSFGFTAVVIQALLPLVARDLVAGGPLTYGVMLGAFGVGAVGGALISGRIRRSMSSEAIVRSAFLGFALCSWLAAWSTYAWLTSAGLLVGGACWVLALSHFNITVQMSTPRWVVGRALSIYQMSTFGGMALGSWIWGVISESHGPSTALIVAGAAMLVGAAIGFLLPLPAHTALNLDPLNRFREPHLALDVQPRSGPIVISIEFIIREEDVPAFLDAMSERRRVRRRDGARNWVLARDLENPEIWVETYHTPTWLEYVRHNQRATLADAEIGDKLRALHSGAQPPRVHRMIERPTSLAAALGTHKGHIELH